MGLLKKLFGKKKKKKKSKKEEEEELIKERLRALGYLE